jgi:hypothetical protein
MKGWLDVAKEFGCETPDERALFPARAEESADVDVALTLGQVKDGNCRREPAWDPAATPPLRTHRRP